MEEAFGTAQGDELLVSGVLSLEIQRTRRRPATEVFSDRQIVAGVGARMDDTRVGALDGLHGPPCALERCRAAALVEVVRASWPAVLETAVQELAKPMDLLDGLKGLPQDLVERVQVGRHIERALRVVPEPLRSEWAQHQPPLERVGQRHRASSAPGAPRRPKTPGGTSSDEAEKASRAAFSLLKRWVRVMRPIVEEGLLESIIAELVHGDPPVLLPTGSMGAEFRRLVPAPEELRGGVRWETIEDLMTILDLEDMIGPVAASPPPRPTEAAAGGVQDWPSAVAALCQSTDRGRCTRPAWASPSGGGALPGRAAHGAPPQGQASTGHWAHRSRRTVSAASGANGHGHRKTWFGTYAKARPPPLRRGLSESKAWRDASLPILRSLERAGSGGLGPALHSPQ